MGAAPERHARRVGVVPLILGRPGVPVRAGILRRASVVAVSGVVIHGRARVSVRSLVVRGTDVGMTTGILRRSGVLMVRLIGQGPGMPMVSGRSSVTAVSMVASRQHRASEMVVPRIINKGGAVVIMRAVERHASGVHVAARKVPLPGVDMVTGRRDVDQVVRMRWKIRNT